MTASRPLTVLYFASVKEKVGVSREHLEVPGSVATVGDLMDWLAARSSGHAHAFAQRTVIKAALDQTHVPSSAALGAAREVAFFPPVTGG